jgi:hypothetical protein
VAGSGPATASCINIKTLAGDMQMLRSQHHAYHPLYWCQQSLVCLLFSPAASVLRFHFSAPRLQCMLRRGIQFRSLRGRPPHPSTFTAILFQHLDTPV